MRTAWFGQAAICAQLVQGKADPSLKATDGAWKGMTALDIAKKASRAPVVALLESSY